MIRTALLMSTLFAATGTAQAHEFWISTPPEAFRSGQVIESDLMVGLGMVGQPYPYLSNRFARFDVVHGNTVTASSGKDGDLPALRFVPQTEGLHTIVHQTVAFRASHDDWPVFLRYLDEEGLQEFERIHLDRGLPRTGFAERYTRYAKALIPIGDIDAGERDEPAGLPFELVVLGDPFDPGQDVLKVQLLRNGEPVRNRQITVFHRTGATVRTVVRTGVDGTAKVHLSGAGDYLLNAVQLEPLDDWPVVWESHWATLSFTITSSAVEM